MLWGIRFQDELDHPDDLAALIRRLHHEPQSMYRAVTDLGGPEWLGWGHEARILADLHDALTYNTSASATNRKAKPPSEKHQYPRPRGVQRKRPARALPSVGSEGD